jgi:aminoglycoside/choline kinase family phosphotransferase
MTLDFHLSPEPSSPRDRDLHLWMQQSLAEQSQLLPRKADSQNTRLELRPLSGDAGFRRYFRLYADDAASGLLLVDAPPETEDTPLFVGLARFLAAEAVRVPHIHVVDEQRGFLLVEDLGDGLLQFSLNQDSAPMLYGQALMDLLHWQQLPLPDHLVVDYDQPMLRRELELFIDWFVADLLGYALSDEERSQLQQVFALLEKSATEQPRVLVHRDFHSRNLLLCAEGNLGIIDFQGAVMGPCTYDLASLLRDCYLTWPQDQVRRWALGYANLAYDAGLIPPVTEENWLRWFDWMGLQRHLKVLGIFSRLWLRDGRPQYLGDLSRVLAYVLNVAKDYPQLNWLNTWLNREILPLARARDWFNSDHLAEIL